MLALFLVLGVFAIEDGAPLHLWVGLVQRIVVAVWFIWMMVTARRLTAGVRHG